MKELRMWFITDPSDDKMRAEIRSADSHAPVAEIEEISPDQFSLSLSDYPDDINAKEFMTLLANAMDRLRSI